MFKMPEKYRCNKDFFGKNYVWGNNGFFHFKDKGFLFYIVASDHEDWEHVSVYCKAGKKNKTPTWEQMCIVKNLFWDETDCVLQYHPRKEDYVNLHPNVLHLWKPINKDFPIPNKTLVF